MNTKGALTTYTHSSFYLEISLLIIFIKNVFFFVHYIGKTREKNNNNNYKKEPITKQNKVKGYHSSSEVSAWVTGCSPVCSSFEEDLAVTQKSHSQSLVDALQRASKQVFIYLFIFFFNNT